MSNSSQSSHSIYECISDENSSVYYSFNETIKDKTKQDIDSDSNIEEIDIGNGFELSDYQPTTIKNLLHESSNSVSLIKNTPKKSVKSLNEMFKLGTTSTPTFKQIRTSDKRKSSIPLKQIESPKQLVNESDDILPISSYDKKQHNNSINNNHETLNTILNKSDGLKNTTNENNAYAKNSENKTLTPMQNIELSITKISLNDNLKTQTVNEEIECKVPKIIVADYSSNQVTEKLIEITPKLKVLGKNKNISSGKVHDLDEENKENLKINNSKNVNEKEHIEMDVIKNSLKKSIQNINDILKENIEQKQIVFPEEKPMNSVKSDSFEVKHVNLVKDESSAKESEESRNIDCQKKKLRKSLRNFKDIKKMINETDSSTSTSPTVSNLKKSVKFQGIDMKNRQTNRQTILPQYLNKHESKVIQKLDSKQSVNNNRKSLVAPKINLHQQKEANSSKDRRKSLASLLTAHPTERLTLLKNTMKDNVLKKPSTKMNNILKTAFNSPTMIRRSIGRKSVYKPPKPDSRKSMIPTKLASSKTQLSTEPTSSTVVMATNAPSTSKLPMHSNGETAKISSTLFNCRICHKAFKYKVELDLHKKVHDVHIKCEYCDKNFAFSRALDNHLLENCLRIPPKIKKKLIEAEINKKSEEYKSRQLNSLFTVPKNFPSDTTSNINHMFSSNLNTASSIVDSLLHLSQKPTQKSAHSLMKSTSSSITDTSTNSENMPAPSLPPTLSSQSHKGSKNKTKNKLPHSGVYQTPKKPIPCYKCKEKFYNVLEFTEHLLSHSSR